MEEKNCPSIMWGWLIGVWGKISKVGITCGFRKYWISDLLSEMAMMWETEWEGSFPWKTLKQGSPLF